jgi:hypothetical protein
MKKKNKQSHLVTSNKVTKTNTPYLQRYKLNQTNTNTILGDDEETDAEAAATDAYDNEDEVYNEIASKMQRRYTLLWENKQITKTQNCIACSSMFRLIIWFLFIGIAWIAGAIPTLPPVWSFYFGILFLPLIFNDIFSLIVSCNKRKRINTVALIINLLCLALVVYINFTVIYQLYLCFAGLSEIANCGGEQFFQFLLAIVTISFFIFSGILVWEFMTMITRISQSQSRVSN